MHRPAHAFDQRLRDRQANARAFDLATVGAQAVEGLEEVSQLLVRHATPGVGHPQQHRRPTAQRFHPHAAPGLVVLDGVGQQVQQHLPQPGGVGQHVQVQCAQRDVQRLAWWLNLKRRHHRQRLLHQRLQRHRLQRDAHLTAFQRRQAQHVVDQRQQVLPGVADVFQPAPPRRRCLVTAALFGQQQLGKAQHRVQRCAQFVAHARQELGLGRTFAQRDLALLAHGVGGADVGDVPGHADATPPTAAVGVDVIDLHRP